METIETVSQYELERGKPVPRFKHSIVQARLVGQLLRHEDKYDVLSEIDVVMNSKPYTPDIYLYPKRPIDWAAEDEVMTAPPLIAVEILSGAQSLDDLVIKATASLKAGAGACWGIAPSMQTIFVMKSGVKTEAYTRGVLTDDATGVAVNVDEFFR